MCDGSSRLSQIESLWDGIALMARVRQRWIRRKQNAKWREISKKKVLNFCEKKHKQNQRNWVIYWIWFQHRIDFYVLFVGVIYWYFFIRFENEARAIEQLKLQCFQTLISPFIGTFWCENAQCLPFAQPLRTLLKVTFCICLQFWVFCGSCAHSCYGRRFWLFVVSLWMTVNVLSSVSGKKNFNRLVCIFFVLVSFAFWCGIHFFFFIGTVFVCLIPSSPQLQCRFISHSIFYRLFIFVHVLLFFEHIFFPFRRINNTIKCASLIALFECVIFLFRAALLRETAGA